MAGHVFRLALNKTDGRFLDTDIFPPIDFYAKGFLAELCYKDVSDKWGILRERFRVIFV